MLTWRDNAYILNQEKLESFRADLKGKKQVRDEYNENEDKPKKRSCQQNSESMTSREGDDEGKPRALEWKEKKDDLHG